MPELNAHRATSGLVVGHWRVRAQPQPGERGVLPGRAITTPRSPVLRTASGGTGGAGATTC